MTLGQFEQSYLLKTKIELDEQNYIMIREPSQQELKDLTGKPDEDVKVFDKIMLDCIVDHTITDDSGEKISLEQIRETLKKSGALYKEILTAWIESIPFRARLSKKAK